ncbi:phospholipid/cholesterol/gamma-HCH transport system permease protein [Stella humosa]|uniref:Phospholipid/cholesterol/gamma-HCH transport system permease protein n=1 Tax=Stella humosa TaxID=94 RepID=A0A3N1L049_9PROT|nr:MlaE family lipid ABC transporter permease subunit [Stella humosa]ROP83836.1 phospholipid/cholesterol/gamma-HCH transport system permease protein [Stella humosa]BBK32903.1 glycoprotein endopeptidase metalloprotease [Stella humosa]
MAEAAVRSASAGVGTDPGGTVLTLAGRLDADGTAAVWAPAMAAAAGIGGLTVDAGGVDYCDGAGVALLAALRSAMGDRPFAIRGLKPQFAALVELVGEVAAPEVRASPRLGPISRLGLTAYRMGGEMRRQVTFVGEVLVYLVEVLRRPGRLRWSDFMIALEAAGVRAVPIMALMGFLIGLIMAFQSAIPMRKFGADLYVADLVSLSMIRELGPLMAAIMLAGRTGSAFAAEIGTMKVNEEVDALTTMGLVPVRFLVVPRVLAGIVVMPFLAMIMNVAGLLGCLVVMMSLGYPPITFLHQLVGSTGYGDLLGGLFKAAVFGLLVAGVGCMRGLQTTTGAAAVGESTTRSVVSGILLIILADGLFAVLFFYLDL